MPLSKIVIALLLLLARRVFLSADDCLALSGDRAREPGETQNLRSADVRANDGENDPSQSR